MSRGPSRPLQLPPIRCTTLELKDLADTQEFDLDGNPGSVYGFELTDDGHYKRKEISEDKKNPKLEQLRNVEVENVGNDVEYKVIRKDNKWHFIPIIDWQIKFEFIAPYTIFTKDKTFRKAFNAGPLHVSLVHDTLSRGEIEIKAFKRAQYLLHRKESVTKPGVTKLKFLPHVPLGNEFTMIVDIATKASHVNDLLMTGINVSWKELDAESLRAIITIQNLGDQIKTHTSNEKVKLNIEPENLTELTTINITNFHIIGFYYTDRVLTEGELTWLLENIN